MILIVGCGKLGGALATRLIASGNTVTVLDHDRQNLETNLPRGFSGTIVEGLEIDNEVLLRAGIDRATAVAAVARAESTNITVADVARKIFHVPHVVVRIDDTRMAALYRQEGFDVISPVLEGTLAVENVLRRHEDHPSCSS